MLNSIGDSINDDLQGLEQEVVTSVEVLDDIYIRDIKETCAAIEKRIRNEYKEAGEKLAKLDTGRTMNTVALLTSNTKLYLDRIRALQLALRRARSTVTPDDSVLSTPVVGHVTSGYKPFIKKLEPPTFSGKIEDWPEFRCFWKDLLQDLPDSIQVQHFKTNIPSADAKAILLQLNPGLCVILVMDVVIMREIVPVSQRSCHLLRSM